MSTNEYIFLDVALDPAEAARQLAEALNMEFVPPPPGSQSGPVVRARSVGGTNGEVGGPLMENYLSDPSHQDERSPYDGCRLMWQVWSTEPGEDYAQQEEQAEQLFRAVVDRLGWPAVLLHDLDLIRASYHPQRGLRYFPSGTTAYVEDESVWGATSPE